MALDRDSETPPHDGVQWWWFPSPTQPFGRPRGREISRGGSQGRGRRTREVVGGGHWWCGVDIDDRPVGNPKRRYDEHRSKSSLVVKPRFIEPVGERTKLWKVMLASFVTLRTMAPKILLVHLHPAATWNLHTTQPRTLLPTYDEVVNLTDLL
jgi:hypothetical protein